MAFSFILHAYTVINEFIESLRLEKTAQLTKSNL